MQPGISVDNPGPLHVLIVGGHSDGSSVDESVRSDTGGRDSLGRTECCPDEHRLFRLWLGILRGSDVKSDSIASMREECLIISEELGTDPLLAGDTTRSDFAFR